MSPEFKVLLKNGTWILVPPYLDQNFIGCKWMFLFNCHVDGSIDKYKERLFAKWYNQHPRIDYGDAFSIVLKPTIIHVVLNIVTTNHRSILQLNIDNAFLHGPL